MPASEILLPKRHSLYSVALRTGQTISLKPSIDYYCCRIAAARQVSCKSCGWFQCGANPIFIGRGMELASAIEKLLGRSQRGPPGPLTSGNLAGSIVSTGIYAASVREAALGVINPRRTRRGRRGDPLR